MTVRQLLELAGDPVCLHGWMIPLTTANSNSSDYIHDSGLSAQTILPPLRTPRLFAPFRYCPCTTVPHYTMTNSVEMAGLADEKMSIVQEQLSHGHRKDKPYLLRIFHSIFHAIL